MSEHTNETMHDDRQDSGGDEGFTLVEVIVVVVIIGILTTAVAFNVLGRVDEARTTRARSDVNSLSGAVQMYRLDMGTYPETLDDLVRAPRDARLAARFPAGGYLDKPSLPEDPWGGDYIYTYPGERGEFDIMSLGSDGEEGGEDTAADIGSWQR